MLLLLHMSSGDRSSPDLLPLDAGGGDKPFGEVFESVEWSLTPTVLLHGGSEPVRYAAIYRYNCLSRTAVLLGALLPAAGLCYCRILSCLSCLSDWFLDSNSTLSVTLRCFGCRPWPATEFARPIYESLTGSEIDSLRHAEK